jgi:hypothetical protein
MCRRLPARLTSEQVALLLGFATHDIPVLVKAGLLGPLGKPKANAVKYFATGDIETVARDSKWLAKATGALYQHWQNMKKRKPSAPKSGLGYRCLRRLLRFGFICSTLLKFYLQHIVLFRLTLPLGQSRD